MQHLEHTLEQIGSGRIHENLRTFGKVLDQCSVVCTRRCTYQNECTQVIFEKCSFTCYPTIRISSVNLPKNWCLNLSVIFARKHFIFDRAWQISSSLLVYMPLFLFFLIKCMCKVQWSPQLICEWQVASSINSTPTITSKNSKNCFLNVCSPPAVDLNYNSVGIFNGHCLLQIHEPKS